MPQASAQSMGGGVGQAVAQLGAGISKVGETINEVARFRGEQAAIQADQEVQRLQLQYQANPNLMLNPNWMDDFDAEVSVIQDKYRQTPFIRTDTFGNKFGVLVGNRKLELGAAAIKHALGAGKDAFKSNLQAYRSDRAKASSPEEKQFYRQQMETTARRAVESGFVTPGEAEIELREALEDSIDDEFTEALYSDDPDRARQILEENRGDLTADKIGYLMKLAWERDGQILATQVAQENARRRQAKDLAAAKDKAAISTIILGTLSPEGMNYDQASQYFGDLSPENLKYVKRIYENNWEGKVRSTATTNDTATFLDLSEKVDNPDLVGPDEEPIPVQLHKALSANLITQQFYTEKLEKFNNREVTPYEDAVGRAVQSLVLMRGDDKVRVFEAKDRMRRWLKANPNATPDEKNKQMWNVVRQFDEYGLSGLSGKPKPPYFKFSAEGAFDTEASRAAVQRDWEIDKKIDRDEAMRRLDEIMKFKASEEARLLLESQ